MEMKLIKIINILMKFFFPIILSTFIFIFINIKNSYLEKFFKFVLIIILVSNILVLKKFNTYCLSDDTPFKNNHSYKVRFGCNIIYAHPFELKNGFNFLKKKESFSFDSFISWGLLWNFTFYNKWNESLRLSKTQIY